MEARFPIPPETTKKFRQKEKKKKKQWFSRKNPMKGLQGTVSDAHTGLGILPVPTSQTGKVIIHREVGRALRKVSSQRWGRVSPRQYC